MAIMNDSERFGQCTPSCRELHRKRFRVKYHGEKAVLALLLEFNDGQADIYGCF